MIFFTLLTLKRTSYEKKNFCEKPYAPYEKYSFIA